VRRAMSFFGPTRCGWGLSPRGPYLRMSRAQPLCVEGAVTMEASHHVAMGWLGDERSCKTDCCCCCRRRCRRGVCGGEYITRGAHRTLPLNLYPPTCLLYLCRLPCLGTHTHTRARSFSHAFYILHPALARSLSLSIRRHSMHAARHLKPPLARRGLHRSAPVENLRICPRCHILHASVCVRYSKGFCMCVTGIGMRFTC